jgi:8-oxo-dGTP pyrophosphatase MutT (NUDIX family)
MAAEALSPAVPAATVVLLRDGPDGPETLMLRRDRSLAFAGGAWVFPGGRIDPPDYPDGAVSTEHSAVEAAARAAAVREAHEEAGLVVDPDDLVWFAHWTPGSERVARRFATWFFMARAPEGAVVVDGHEIREHRWIRPADALARHAAEEIELIVPTWMTLHVLGERSSTDDALRWARAHDPSVYVTHLVEIEGGRASLWQGDAGYDDYDTTRPGPRHRLVMLDDGWHLERS